MILRLVDRRTECDKELAEVQGAAWELLQRLAARVGGADWPVDLVLVDDEAMAELNGQYRALPAVTDVLSFSYLASSGNGPCDLGIGQAGAASDLWRDETPDGAAAGDAVGELVLALDFVGNRCQAEGWPLGLEIPWLVVHGCLHLLGWDHEEPEAARAMQDLEWALLAEEGLAHPLRQRS